MTDDPETTPLIDSYALGVDLVRAFGVTILDAAEALQADNPDNDEIHVHLRVVAEMGACVTALNKTCELWDTYMDANLESMADDEAKETT